VRRLKILIHGQEVETLAGHLDLTGAFVSQPSRLLFLRSPQLRRQARTRHLATAPAAAPAKLTTGESARQTGAAERKP